MTRSQRKLLSQAFADMDKAKLDSLDSYPPLSVATENLSMAKSRAVIDDYKQKHRSRGSMPLRRKIAVIIIATLLAISAVMSVSAIRNPIIEFFVEIFDDFSHLFIDEKTNDEIDEYYTPAYVPDGFVQDNYTDSNTWFFVIWTDGTGDSISLTQTVGCLNDILMDNELAEYSVAEIGDYTVHYVCKNDIYMCIWSDDSYIFRLKCPESLGFETVENMISSLQPIEQE